MSLLASDDEDYEGDYGGEGEDQPVLRSQTGEPLFPEKTGKPKKADKRYRGAAEDKKGSSKWSKQKENIVQEKTPKKGKGQVASKSSSSKTPPDSPKSSRPSEGKAGKGSVSSEGKVVMRAPSQPSPHMKNQRKSYLALEAGSSSSEEEGTVKKDAFLFSNQPALRDEAVTANPSLLDQSSNPFLDAAPPLFPATSAAAMAFSSGPAMAPPMLSAPLLPTGTAIFSEVQQQQAWLPATQPPMDTSLFQPSPAEQSSFPVLSAANPLLMMADSSQFSETNPFLPSTSAPLSMHSPPHQPSPATNSASPWPTDVTGSAGGCVAGGVAGSSGGGGGNSIGGVGCVGSGGAVAGGSSGEWNISADLHSKCVHQFDSLNPVNGVLQGDKAREFFVQSKLPNQELSAIW